AVLGTAVAFGGCTATVAGDGYGPDLVSVGPGVSVIADYDEPIFYSDGFYWRNYGNTWYRSPRYTGGWVYAAPPPAVMRIDRPYAYRHYRPSGYANQPRGWRGGPAAPARQPMASGGWRGGPAAPAPVRAAPA